MRTNTNNHENDNENDLTAQDYRRMGNDQFAAKQFDVALTLYSQAIIACANTNKATTTNVQDCVDLILHYCNRSACLLAICMGMDSDACASAVHVHVSSLSTSGVNTCTYTLADDNADDKDKDKMLLRSELLCAEKAVEDARTAWDLCLELHLNDIVDRTVTSSIINNNGHNFDVDSINEVCHVTAKSAFRLSKGLLTCIGLLSITCNDRNSTSSTCSAVNVLVNEKQSEALKVLQSALEFLSQQNNEVVQEKCENYRSYLSKLKMQMERDISILIAEQQSQWKVKAEKQKQKQVGVKDFEMCQELGTGNFSQVVVARHKITKVQYALKIIEKKKAEQLAKRQHPNVYNEIQMERRVLLEKLAKPSRHPFIIRMHAAFQDYYSLYYLMDLHHDLSQGPNLHAELWEANRYKGFSVGAHFSLIPVYIAEVLEAIQFCHTRGVVHRDLKPENVLIQENGHICLIDFGTAKDLDNTDLNGPEFVGTPEYMSPEAVKGSSKDKDMPCGYAMDYWALGVMIYNLHIGVTSFCSPSPYLAFFENSTWCNPSSGVPSR
uniref:non-specific serine/threonine protein kinase n=1 Tax=Leptocylindrus danicus TaxID=163516 RepID=A0A6U2NU09_9STRA|mmetsp:Transcript_23106/g.34692  ORF Transcript_23106/g.34692 Transcript_23106/m.34692 type:complete len:551 (+) Transcript_23106:84-1736(+)